MSQLFSWCFRRGGLLLGIVFAVAVGCLFPVFPSESGSVHFWEVLRVDVSSEVLIPETSEHLEIYRKNIARFGSDEVAFVYAEHPELFTPGRLTSLQRLGLDLAQLDGVQRVESIFTVSTISGGSGWVDTSPVMRTVPTEQSAVDIRRDRALSNPLLLGQLLSEDGTATVLTVYLEPDRDSDDATFVKAVEAQLEPLRDDFEALFQLGDPAVEALMSDWIRADQVVLLPLAAVVLLVLIGLSLRSGMAAFIVLANASVATLWTVAFMALFGIPVNMLNSVVPALILIIGATEDVHVFAEYRHFRALGQTGQQAVSNTGRNIGLTLLLTAGTTVLGFLVTGISELPILRSFALTASVAMALRGLLSLIVMPAWLRLPCCGSGKFQTEAMPFEEVEGRKRSHLETWALRALDRPGRCIAVFAFLGGAALLLVPGVRVSNDATRFLDEESELIRRLSRFDGKLAGTKVINIELSAEAGSFTLPERLRGLAEITDWLRQDVRIGSVVSFADYLALVNRAMFGDPNAALAVPDSAPLIAQYLIFFHRSQLQPYISADYGTANIVLRTRLNDSAELNNLVADIRAGLSSNRFQRFGVAVTGQSVLVADGVGHIVLAQTASLATICLLLGVSVGVLFLSFRAGAVAVLSNLFPVAVVFGIMAVFAIPLNVGTCMVAAITIGIAVDDTLHLMTRYNRQLRRERDELQAIRQSLSAELKPVSVTSISLACGFLVLGFSNFVPVRQFGVLSAIVMILALISDLVLTPVLLSKVRLLTLWDVLGLRLRERLKRRSLIFAGMSDWDVRRLVLLSNLQEHDAGEQIVREGAMGEMFYILVDGKALVSRKGQDDETIELATLEPGDVFGEIALVSRVKRTASVTCSEKSKILALDWDALQRLQRYSPRLSSCIFLNLSRILGLKLRETNLLVTPGDTGVAEGGFSPSQTLDRG